MAHVPGHNIMDDKVLGRLQEIGKPKSMTFTPEGQLGKIDFEQTGEALKGAAQAQPQTTAQPQGPVQGQPSRNLGQLLQDPGFSAVLGQLAQALDPQGVGGRLGALGQGLAQQNIQQQFSQALQQGQEPALSNLALSQLSPELQAQIRQQALAPELAELQTEQLQAQTGLIGERTDALKRQPEEAQLQREHQLLLENLRQEGRISQTKLAAQQKQMNQIMKGLDSGQRRDIEEEVFIMMKPIIDAGFDRSFPGQTPKQKERRKAMQAMFQNPLAAETKVTTGRTFLTPAENDRFVDIVSAIAKDVRAGMSIADATGRNTPREFERRREIQEGSTDVPLPGQAKKIPAPSTTPQINETEKKKLSGF